MALVQADEIALLEQILAATGGGGGGGTVDTELSPTSTNAVQNKKIYEGITKTAITYDASTRGLVDNNLT